MSLEDLESYEAELELKLEREYRDVCSMFRFVVETERRFYLCNGVQQVLETHGGRPVVRLELTDAWVWDVYRQNRFVPTVRVVTYKDVNVEELPSADLPDALPES